MTGTKTTLKRYAALSAATLIASAAMLTVGCGNMETTATTTSPEFGSNATMTGKLHGGNQPVSGATVQLFSVAFNGVGSGQANTTTVNGQTVTGNLLATTTTNASGGFGFSKQTTGGPYANTGNQYTCPTGIDAPLYIKTTGGNTTGNGASGVNNSAAIFLAPVGACSTVNAGTFINISEVTTAATVAALAQYINPSTEFIGADGISIAYVAVLNSMKTVATLVNSQSGLANTSLAIPGSTNGLQTSNVTITATPESAKLNTIANILSSCINQVSATSANNCSTLFTNATAPGTLAIQRSSQPNATFPTATDTLQAALYMFLRPTDATLQARTNLYNLSPATGAPYQPTITSLPTDWTIAISYANGGQCGTSNSLFFASVSEVNVDINGNLWISNNQNGGALSQMSPNGVAMTCASNLAKGLAGGTVDDQGNVWVGDASANFIYRLTAPGSTQISANNPVNTVKTYATAGPVMAITADGADNVFFTTVVNGTGFVYIIKAGATSPTVNAPVGIANTVGTSPMHIFPDTAGDLFVTSGANYITQLSTSNVGTATNGYLSSQITGLPSPTVGVVVGNNNRVYVTSADPGASLTVLAPPATAGSNFTIVGTTPANTGGLSNPQGVFLDGGQTSYSANGTQNSQTQLFSLSVVAVQGTTVTEVSATGNANGGYQKSLQYFNQMHNITLDQSGNIWITNNGNPYSITEVVGAGVMIYQSYAYGLSQPGSRFQSIT